MAFNTPEATTSLMMNTGSMALIQQAGLNFMRELQSGAQQQPETFYLECRQTARIDTPDNPAAGETPYAEWINAVRGLQIRQGSTMRMIVASINEPDAEQQVNSNYIRITQGVNDTLLFNVIYQYQGYWRIETLKQWNESTGQPEDLSNLIGVTIQPGLKPITGVCAEITAILNDDVLYTETEPDIITITNPWFGVRAPYINRVQGKLKFQSSPRIGNPMYLYRIDGFVDGIDLIHYWESPGQVFSYPPIGPNVKNIWKYRFLADLRFTATPFRGPLRFEGGTTTPHGTSTAWLTANGGLGNMGIWPIASSRFDGSTAEAWNSWSSSVVMVNLFYYFSTPNSPTLVRFTTPQSPHYDLRWNNLGSTYWNDLFNQATFGKSFPASADRSAYAPYILISINPHEQLFLPPDYDPTRRGFDPTAAYAYTRSNIYGNGIAGCAVCVWDPATEFYTLMALPAMLTDDYDPGATKQVESGGNAFYALEALRNFDPISVYRLHSPDEAWGINLDPNVDLIEYPVNFAPILTQAASVGFSVEFWIRNAEPSTGTPINWQPSNTYGVLAWWDGAGVPIVDIHFFVTAGGQLQLFFNFQTKDTNIVVLGVDVTLPAATAERMCHIACVFGVGTAPSPTASIYVDGTRINFLAGLDVNGLFAPTGPTTMDMGRYWTPGPTLGLGVPGVIGGFRIAEAQFDPELPTLAIPARPYPTTVHIGMIAEWMTTAEGYDNLGLAITPTVTGAPLNFWTYLPQLTWPLIRQNGYPIETNYERALFMYELNGETTTPVAGCWDAVSLSGPDARYASGSNWGAPNAQFVFDQELGRVTLQQFFLPFFTNQVDKTDASGSWGGAGNAQVSPVLVEFTRYERDDTSITERIAPPFYWRVLSLSVLDPDVIPLHQPVVASDTAVDFPPARRLLAWQHRLQITDASSGGLWPALGFVESDVVDRASELSTDLARYGVGPTSTRFNTGITVPWDNFCSARDSTGWAYSYNYTAVDSVGEDLYWNFYKSSDTGAAGSFMGRTWASKFDNTDPTLQPDWINAGQHDSNVTSHVELHAWQSESNLIVASGAPVNEAPGGYLVETSLADAYYYLGQGGGAQPVSGVALRNFRNSNYYFTSSSDVEMTIREDVLLTNIEIRIKDDKGRLATNLGPDTMLIFSITMPPKPLSIPLALQMQHPQSKKAKSGPSAREPPAQPPSTRTREKKRQKQT